LECADLKVLFEQLKRNSSAKYLDQAVGTLSLPLFSTLIGALLKTGPR